MKKISFLFILLFCAVIYSQEERSSRQTDIPSATTIGVTIGGNFIITGTFPSFVNERLDQFVTRIYNQAVQNRFSRTTDPATMRKIAMEVENFAFRNIKLKRISGEDLDIDLLKFRRTGDYQHNPYLRHDDVIIFPPTDIERNFFTVSGAVMKPGKYHYFEGDRLNDALDASEGINNAYENITVRIYRTSYDGTRTDIINGSINDNIVIQRGDRIILLADEPQKKDFNITVLGEVNNPGKIPIARNSTTLREVIERAGGVKSTASLKNSRLYTGNSAEYMLERIYGVKSQVKEEFDFEELMIRRELVETERMLMYRLSNLTIEDSTYFSVENSLRVISEGTSFDLTGIEEPASAVASYLVKDGDLLVIPTRQSTVYLFGSVVQPGHISFEEGKKADYYINKAGGLGEYAKKDEISVIKGNTRKWVPLKHNPVVEEGDYIYVPRDEPRTFNYYVEITSRYLGIVGSLATIILLLYQFGRGSSN
jgi:protein involved in polysaccharide export with SLBB domain